MTTNIARTISAVGPVREWLLDLAILVAEKTTVLTSQLRSSRNSAPAYHRLRIGIRCCLGIPLHRNLARWTRIRTVSTRLAALVGTHGPTTIRSAGDWYQPSVFGKLTLASPFVQTAFVQFKRIARFGSRRSASLVVQVSMLEACRMDVAMFG